MAIGRPRKAIAVSTGARTKKEKLSRAIQEEKLKIDSDNLIAPEWLDDFATEEFMRVVEEASKIDILDNLDLSTLAIYANAYSRYIETVELIRKNGMVELRGTTTIVAAAVRAQEGYVRQILQCSTKLGLAATDRLKLVVPEADKPNANRYLDKLLFVK